MKRASYLLAIFIFLVIQFLFINPIKFTSAASAADNWKNIYGIVWCGKPAEDMRYAKQMGYEYIAINPSSFPKEYHKNPDGAGLKFYLIDPYFYPQVLSGYNRDIDTTGSISDEAKDFYNQRMVWKSNDSFPGNLATGYHPAGASTQFSIMWDFQQQAVIDEVVEKIINLAKSYEDTSLPFTFGGYIINEPKLAGEFYRLDEKGDNVSVGLSYWTGADSGLVHGAITHEYATYSEGRAAFYKQLRARMSREFTNPKWIVQPTLLYSEVDNDEWIYQIKDRADKDELTPDMLSQESEQNTNFVDDANNFNSGVNITKGKVGNSQSGEVDEYKNRLFAARAGINGAWYNWFWRFGGTGDMPDFERITKVYPRLKLIRCLPNWDNLNNVSFADRSWDGRVYQSTKSYASSDVMYSRHPKTGKLFAVFLTLSGVITLNAGETVTSVERTDGFFVESGDGNADVNITGNEIRLKSRKDIGKGYIFTLSSLSDGNSSTGLETDETFGSAASNGKVNGRGLTNTTWVKYGTTSGSHNSVSSKQRTKTILSQQSVSAQTTWQKVAKRTQAQKTAGLSGGEGWQMIFGINYAPSNGNIAYLVTDTNQVWKTTNANGTETVWNRKANGFLPQGGISLAVDPTNENIVYVAGSLNMPEVNESVLNPVEGILRTTDGGDTWTLVTSYSYTTYGPQAHFHRSAKGGLHIAFAGSALYAAPSTGGLLKSTNGTTWTRLSKSGGGYVLDTVELYNISAHPTDNTILFVSAPNGLYKVKDSGGSATVTKIGTGLPAGAVYQLQINRSAPNTMYIATGANGVYRSTDGGLNFSPRNNGLSLPIGNGAMFLAMSPANPNRLFVTFGAWGKHLYYTTDGGANWTQTSNMDEENGDGWVAGSTFGYTSNLSGVDTAINPIAFHPTNENIAFVAGWGNQIKKTTDGGVTWKYSNTGYIGATESQAGSVPIGWDSTNPNRATFFHMDFGPMITTDGESTFRNIYTTWNGRQAAVCGAMRGNIIVAAFGPNDQQRIHISRDSGASWTAVSGADANFFFCAFHPQNPNIVYVSGYASNFSGSRAYKFTDIQNTNTFTTPGMMVMGIFKGNGNIVYSYYAEGPIYKSTDAGVTWTTPYPSLNIPSGFYIKQIAIDPTNENRIYVTVWGKGVYIITDTAANGGTVLVRNEAHGLALSQFGSVDTLSIVTDPNNPGVVYTGAIRANRGQSNGVFRSTDSGVTWTNISGNLGPQLNVVNLSVNPYNSYVYLDSYSGTWKLPPPLSTSTADTTAPNCSISINSGASYTNSTAVTLTLSATDNVGVTGYYLSTSATKPLASATGWTSISSTTNYTGNVSYTLSTGDGSKTVYVWYKDAAGNVSNTANDSITLDKTVPSITITSPTSSAAYTTTSSTINLGGSASDSMSVSSVAWSNSKGGSGTASGTTSWSISGISLSSGDNIITVTVKDGANNVSSDTITVTYNSTALAVKSITVKKTPSPLTIDGNLNESVWSLDQSADRILSGTFNNTSTFDVLYDDNYLYVAFKVLDSNLINDSTNPWEDDSVELYLDPNNSKSTTYDTYDRQFIKGYNDNTLAATQNGTGVLHGTVNITGGYTVELAIPWSNLGVTSVTGSTLGFDVQINDDDDGAGRDNFVSWNNGVSDTNYKDTSNFGNITLSDATAISDTTPPACSISINSGDSYTNSTNVTLSLSATDDVGVTGYYLSNSSTTPLVSATGWTSISSTTNYSGNVSYALSAGEGSKTVYVWYKDASGNVSSPALDSISLETTAPTGSININGDATYTKSTSVTLFLSATDDVGVTGYFLSDSATTPSTSAAGWMSITSTTNYSGSVSYNLSSGDGSKTALQSLRPFHSGEDGSKAVYVWFRDVAGNVSNVAADSIIWDKTVPSITITSPTSNSTYTATSSTVNLGGSVSGSTNGVSSVAWSNSTGGSGTASGTTNWSISGISLSSGDNVITVTVTDKANNTSTDTITVTYIAGTIPTVTTGSAANVTSSNATLTETVNANGLSTTAWFEYGLVSGSYGSKSSTQVVSGSSNTQVSISISGLSSGKTYYYRIVAQNSAGTTYGTEMSFTTGDTTTPTSSININGGAAYTKSTSVTLSLSATDDVGVTGYYLSTSSTTPLASATGWTSVTSTTNYSGSVSYTLSSGDGSKTVYTWFKDAAGNVSNVASDSITLDTTIPVITITSPTSNSTYTATSSTVNLGGSASDSTSGVSSVAWSNSKGGSGTANGTASWSITGIALSSGDNIITVTVTDMANNIATDTITVTYIAGTIPTVTTGSAANVTSNDATLNGTVNANGLSTTAWFEYGLVSGSYGSKSSTQVVSGSSNTQVSISISGLSSGKTYYYRIVAQNSAGTTYGTEMSFTTGDTTTPNCSISINSGDSYANSTTVTLDLSATDDVGVTGYYLSTSSTTPLVSATGWTSVTSTTSYSAGVSYTLSSGDGSKTVYAWFKDAAGNVSNVASDSITLDTTVPTVTITSPTSSAAYTTTSSTINLGGSASDSMSISSVAWSNSKGESGTATGIANWSVSNIALQMGDNVITVTARDVAGNTQSATLTITKNETTTDGYGLVGYWKLDETSETTAADSSGSGNNGALINGPVWTTGKVNNALSFDGVNDYVTTADTPFDFERTNSFSASVWIKTSISSDRAIISKETAASPYAGWAFYVEPTSVRVHLTSNWNTNAIRKLGGKNIADNSWHHVAFTYNGTSLASGVNIYIDGVLSNGTVEVDNLSASILNNTSVQIGAYPSPGGFFNGLIDEVRVYNRELSAAEVEQLYNMGK